MQHPSSLTTYDNIFFYINDSSFAKFEMIANWKPEVCPTIYEVTACILNENHVSVTYNSTKP